jgi:indolepyruvate ferredoxin oxidoreductase alpha subunit
MAAAAELVKRHLRLSEKVMIVEEVLPFIEDQVKILAAEQAGEIGSRRFTESAKAFCPRLAS